MKRLSRSFCLLRVQGCSNSACAFNVVRPSSESGNFMCSCPFGITKFNVLETISLKACLSVGCAANFHSWEQCRLLETWPCKKAHQGEFCATDCRRKTAVPTSGTLDSMANAALIEDRLVSSSEECRVDGQDRKLSCDSATNSTNGTHCSTRCRTIYCGSKSPSENKFDAGTRERICLGSASYKGTDRIFRGFRFDRIMDAEKIDPVEVAELDSLTMCTLKTVELPAPIIRKLQLLLRHVGRKKYLEKAGRLMAEKITARTSVELPRVLPTQLIPEAHSIIAEVAHQEASCSSTQNESSAGSEADASDSHIPRRRESSLNSVESLLKGKDTKILRGLPGAEELLRLELPADGLDAQQGLARAEDARHPLYRHIFTSHSPLTATAITAHRYAGAYASLVRILSEVRARCPGFFPRRVIEMNAGFAAGLMALDAVFRPTASQSKPRGITDTSSLKNMPEGNADINDSDASFDLLMAVEPSSHLGAVGRYITADLSPKVEWRLALYNEGLLRPQAQQEHNCDGAALVDDRFDLIMLPHALLRTVDGQESRHAMVRTLWNRLRPQGMLLFLERGTPTGFRVLASVRELFICELGVGKFHFVAPCPHESVCPMALTGRDWCHFAQRVRRLPHYLYCKGSRAKAVEEEKFSFLVVRKGPGPRQKYPHPLNASGARVSGAELSYFWPRIVAPPIKGGEHVLLDVCAAPHRFERIAVSKHMPHAAGYKPARHAAWGDLWRHPRKLIRPVARPYMQQEISDRLDSRHMQKVKHNSHQEEGQHCDMQSLEDSLIRNFG